MSGAGLANLPLEEPLYPRLFRAPVRWFNIPAHRPFVVDLARGLVDALSPIGAEALSDAIVLTPTRRGMRALTEAFVTASGGQATLLPQIRALGDLEDGEPPFEPGDLALDLPPAVSPLRRRFELARLICDNAHVLDQHDISTGHALELADALGGFLDSVQIEEVSVEGRLERLVEADLAEHWRKTSRLLALAVDLWPKRLGALGLIDVMERRTRLLRALAEAWTLAPPTRPLIAAGSTGSAPATAALLKVVASAPQGLVVLPGLDQDLDDTVWDQIGDAHPQLALKRLLERVGVTRAQVNVWPSHETPAQAVTGRSRRKVVNEALRPAEATDDWLSAIAALRAEGEQAGVDPVAEGLAGLKVIAARDDRVAAEMIALALRETLETPGRTAALLTPDAALSRRVSATLSRWGITPDDSAGRALAEFPVGVILSLVARAACDPLNPVLLLAILKHRFTRLGAAELTLAGQAREVERLALRGPRPRDVDQLRARLASSPDALGCAENLIRAISHAASAFAAGNASAPEAIRQLVEAVEILAVNEKGVTGELWAGPEGESAAALVATILRDGHVLPTCGPEAFARLLDQLLAEETVRIGGATHPRLRILGAMEGRMVRADLVILAGLEEGVWPRPGGLDPFLSRAMRKALDLPTPERKIGLAAHDFAQAACAPDVLLISRERRDGGPAVKSRWLWRLETLARGAKIGLSTRPDLIAAQAELDRALKTPPASLEPARRPEPRPPVGVRPRELPVTAVETWTRDPYAVYARYILRLRPIDRPDRAFDNRVRGTAIHAATESFAKGWPWPEADAERQFSALYLEALKAAGAPDVDLVREAALGRQIGAWISNFERQRRGIGVRVETECAGRLTFAAPGGNFTVTARADRIEVKEGRADIIDFKTGQAPTFAQIKSGFSPQLSLTAAIVQADGFDKIKGATPGRLDYVRLTGRDPPGEVVRRDRADATATSLAEEALAGLQKKVAEFDHREAPYMSRTAMQFLKTPSDYDHLARLKEWASDEGDE